MYFHIYWSYNRTRNVIFSILLLTLISVYSDARVHKGVHFCHFFESEACRTKGDCAVKIVDCSQLRDDSNTSLDIDLSHMQCFVSWKHTNVSSEPSGLRKGCWMNHDQCKNTSECVESRPAASSFFCCCDQNSCNKDFHHRPKPTRPGPDRLGGGHNEKEISSAQEYERIKTVLQSIVPIVAVFFIVVVFFFMWRRHQRHIGHQQLPTIDPIYTPTQASSFNLQLIEHKAKGRFGYVWKAKMLDQYVAVKIFPLADKKSFTAEVDIYKQSNLSHENVLHFIGAEVKEEASYTEFYLISEYHEKGSLYDFLKANTITWAQLCRIGESMMCGLAYLHDEIPGTFNCPKKPAVAHRDFKSKNVLVKSDLTACIADFGLALAFDPNMGVNETHTLVGTRRYMAPEVLEGAICFNMDSFLRIDMYACSLVLWELMTRCTCVEDIVDDYRLPFEAEVGLQPSLEEMQPLVVGQKRRPAIRPAWYQSPGMASLVTTMEECWDQDAEARLSAGCVHDRIVQLSRTINSGGGDNMSPQLQQQHQIPLLLPSQQLMYHPVIQPPLAPHQSLPPPPLYVPNNNNSSSPMVIDSTATNNSTNLISHNSSVSVSPRDLTSC